jgi:hypothetical protein
LSSFADSSDIDVPHIGSLSGRSVSILSSRYQTVGFGLLCEPVSENSVIDFAHSGHEGDESIAHGVCVATFFIKWQASQEAGWMSLQSNSYVVA